MIIAVKTNSNILLSSVALIDLLVGAVSMPLSTSLGTLVIHIDFDVNIICNSLQNRRDFLCISGEL